MMEGKMSGEGLEDLDEGDDMMTEMVKELLHEGGMGESADDIWRNLASERAKMLSFNDTTAYLIDANGTDLETGQAFEAGRSAISFESMHKVVEPELWSTYRTGPVRVFTWNAESESCRKPYPLGIRRRRLTHKQSGQLSLFEMPRAL